LSLSGDDITFIGSLVLETRKRIGWCTMPSLENEYGYYSYVPEMLYNDTDVSSLVSQAGMNSGTSIGEDDVVTRPQSYA